MTDGALNETCSIFLEHQPLPDSYPREYLPCPGMTGYMAEIADVNMQDFWHVGFFGPPGLVPESDCSGWDAQRALSWVALAISEEPADGVVEILGVIDRGVLDNSTTMLRVSARKDLAGRIWPLDRSLSDLAAPAVAERKALKLGSSLPEAAAKSIGGPRM